MKVNSHRRRRPGEPRRPRRLSLFRVRDWRVPTKLAAVLVLPAVAFLVIAGVQINSSVANARRLDQFAQGVKVGRQLTALVQVLQTERDRTAGLLAHAATARTGPTGPVAVTGDLTADYRATDAALADFFRAARPLTAGSGLAAALPTVDNDFAQLPLMRAGVRDRWLRQSAVFDQYTTMIQHLYDLVPTGSELGGDAESTRNVASLLDLAQAKELTDQLRGRIFAACSAGVFGPDDFETFAEIQARQVAAVQRFRSLASPAHLARYDESLRGPAVSSVTRLQQTVISRARGTAVNVSAEEWWRSSTNELALIRYVEQDLLEDAIQGAAGRSSFERRNAFIAISVIVLIMVLALLLSWLIGRSMARSLRQLRTQALDVAQHRLPEAINRLRTLPRGETITVDTTSRVVSSDEIGEVAEAFTAVHRSAVSLAVEQAVMRRNVNAMFINLARRSQTLVERQLQLLDALEAAETDPDQLASLFRLDHLATRMRRNDENLLVLAGSEATRRWAQPVALSAVSMAAMAEIEQYARIRHDVTSDVFVVGHAVADLVHLLAELLENATSFSPPDTVVNVTGTGSPDGSEATIVIEDHGMGMGPAGLQEANARVDKPVTIDVAASERMGLVVVGHLAGRHGVGVRLDGSPAGVTAYVTIPARLLAAAPDGGGLYGSATGRLTIQIPEGPAPSDEDTQVVGDGRATDDTVVVRSAPATALPPGIAPALPVWPPLPAAEPLPHRGTSSVPSAPVSGNPPAPVSGAATNGGQLPHAPVSGAPVSGVPVSGAPVSGVPVSGVPVSGAPVSGAPVSGVPDSGAPASGAPASGAPRSGAPASNGPATGREPARASRFFSSPELGGAPARPAIGPANGGTNGATGQSGLPKRLGAGRAEDIIGAAAGSSRTPARATRWWSKDGGAPGQQAGPAVPKQRTPVIGGTSGVGLPIRVPMAQLPSDTRQGEPMRQSVPVAMPAGEPDPDEVSSMLKQFYSGIHRAANEDDVPTVPINDLRGARRDAEPTST
jgi:hypothetical protein